MIAAGTLLYRLTFKEIQTLQSDSGAVSKTPVELFKCRAAKVDIPDQNAHLLRMKLTTLLRMKMTRSLRLKLTT